MKLKVWVIISVGAIPLFFYTNCSEMASMNQPSLSGLTSDLVGGNGDSETGSPSEKFSGNMLDVSQPFSCNYAEAGASNKGIRRLSGAELKNSLMDLFGSSVMNSSSVSGSLALLPSEENIEIVEGWRNSINYVAGLYELGKNVSTYIFSSGSRVESLLPGCSSNPIGTNCKNSFSSFAKKVFRRPLTSQELSELESFVDGFSDKTEGRRLALVRLLMSPYFHQHMELSDTSGDGMRLRLNQYEVASRLAYRVTGTMPDSQLLNAAEQGMLSSLDQVKTQAERLVNTSAARKHFKNFLIYWFRIEVNGDPSSLMQKAVGINPNGMTAEMRQEFDQWVDYVVFQNNGSFKDLLTSQVMFPSTPRLAQLLSTSQSNNPVSAPEERGGVLFRPLVMNIGQSNSNPIARGVLLRKRLMCFNLPSPNSTVVNSRLNGLEELSPNTHSSREIVTQITNSASCMGCHSQINPIGFVFESYGPFGEYRTVEKVYDNNGNLVAQHPVNPSVSNLPLAGRDPISVSSAPELARELASTPSVMRCYSQQYHRFSRLRDAENTDGCSLNSSTQILESGGSIKSSIVNNVVNENIFWRRNIN